MQILTGLAVLVLAAMLVACGGEEDRVLHLAGQDIKESQVRFYVRAEFSKNESAYALVCRAMLAISDGLNAALSGLQQFGFSKAGSAPGATPVPDQKGNDSDVRRLGEILLEECDRAFGR